MDDARLNEIQARADAVTSDAPDHIRNEAKVILFIHAPADIRALLEEVRTKNQETADLRANLAEVDRLCAEINAELHPEGSGPESPSQCDLVGYVKADRAALRARAEKAERLLQETNHYLWRCQDFILRMADACCRECGWIGTAFELLQDDTCPSCRSQKTLEGMRVESTLRDWMFDGLEGRCWPWPCDETDIVVSQHPSLADLLAWREELMRIRAWLISEKVDWRNPKQRVETYHNLMMDLCGYDDEVEQAIRNHPEMAAARARLQDQTGGEA